MHDDDRHTEEQDGGEPDELTRKVEERARELDRQAGPGKRLEVEVERRGKWFVLEGWVNSLKLKSRLLAWVPRIHGAQWVIDRIRVRKKHRPEE